MARVLPEAQQLFQAAKQVEPLRVEVVPDLMKNGHLFSLTAQLLVEVRQRAMVTSTEEGFKQL